MDNKHYCCECLYCTYDIFGNAVCANKDNSRIATYYYGKACNDFKDKNDERALHYAADNR